MDDIKNIIERAKKGDTEAFSHLYQSYYNPVYRYFRIRMSRREDLSKAYKAMPGFTLRGSTALPFFYTIAKNTLIDFRKKKRPIEVSNEKIDIAGDETPQTHATTNEDKDMVYKMLDKLTDFERDAIVMKFIDDLSNKEIARLIGRTEETVRQLQSRGLRKLKALFD
mgnify:CR=1 FL=1